MPATDDAEPGYVRAFEANGRETVSGGRGRFWILTMSDHPHGRARAITAWLNKVACNLIIDNPHKPGEPLNPNIAYPASGPGDLPVEGEEAALSACFTQLTHEQRFVILQHLVEDLTFEEIAQNLRRLRNLPQTVKTPNEDSAKQMYHRGMTSLKDCMKAHGREEL